MNMYTVSIGCSDGVLRILTLSDNEDELGIVNQIEWKINPNNDLVLHHDSVGYINAWAMDSGNLSLFNINGKF